MFNIERDCFFPLTTHGNRDQFRSGYVEKVSAAV